MSGEITHVPTESVGNSRWWSALGLAVVLLATLGMAAVGAVLWVLFPDYSSSAVDIATRRTGRALLAGLAWATLGPLLVAMLFISVVGIPLGAAMGGAYLLSFPLGYLVSAACVSRQLAGRAKLWRGDGVLQRMVGLSAALLLLGIVGLVPFVGALSMVTLTLLGTGALGVAAYDAYRRGHRMDAPRPPDGVIPPARAASTVSRSA